MKEVSPQARWSDEQIVLWARRNGYNNGTVRHFTMLNPLLDGYDRVSINWRTGNPSRHPGVVRYHSVLPSKGK